MEIFLELTTIVFVATVVSVVMRLLKQPLIVGYILSGILVGPYFFNTLHSSEFIEPLSKIGITILLFIVGLNMSPKVIREVGKVSLLTGIGQIVLTSAVGFVLAIALGIDKVAALFIAIALTFSSTIIILKLLSDKGDLNTLYGKISIGFLLVQDIIASIILIIISSINGSGHTSVINKVILTLLQGFNIAAVLYLVTTYVLPKFTKFIAHSQELLFLFSICWGLGLASLFYLLGFSAEIGALIAGVSLSVTPFAFEIGSRLKPLRDFFIVLFFILVGSQMELDTLPRIIIPAIIFSLFVLVGNPIIMIVIMNLLGYKRKTAYLTGLTVAQISEFSLILASIAFDFGQLSRENVSLIALVGLITIAGSTYLILYAHRLYPYIERYLKFLEFKKVTSETRLVEQKHDVILFGFDRVGHDFVHMFQRLQKDYLVVDFNPHLIDEMQKKNIPNKYGDAEDIEFLHELNLKHIQMCVSTIPDVKTSLLLLKHIKKENNNAIVIMLTHDISSAQELYENGASYVILPHYLSAHHLVNLISKLGFNKKEFEEEKQKHLQYIIKKQQ